MNTRLCFLICLLAVSIGVLPLRAAMEAEELEQLFQERVRAVVVVTFTVEHEIERNAITRAGAVIDGEGRIVIQDIPPMPPTQFKDFRVHIPGEHGEGYPATYLGWQPLDDHHVVQADESAWKKLTPVSRFETSVPSVGEWLWGIGLMDEEYDFEPVFLSGRLSVTQALPRDMGFSINPLANEGSLVFDANGALAGWAGRDIVQEVYVHLRGRWYQAAIQRKDESSSFLLAEPFLEQIERMPILPGLKPLPWMGVVGVEPLDADAADFLGLEDQGAVVISDVIEGAPADKAGLVGRDVIVSINDEPLPRFRPDAIVADYVFRRLGMAEVGETLTLGIIRGREAMEIPVTLGAEPDNPRSAQWEYFASFGFSIREFLISDAVRQRSLKLDNPGVIARFVKPDSPASAAGLESGDWIREIEGAAVDSYEDARGLLESLQQKKGLNELVMMIRRENETKVLRLKLN